MAAIVEYVKEIYDDVHKNYGDERTKNWYMIRTPFPTLFLVAAYMLFVKIIGPRMMENRKPYELKTVMIVYNAIQAALALFLFFMTGIYGWFNRYNLVCEPYPDHAKHPDDQVMLYCAFGFYFIRFLEFTDTIIFILRKKFNQVTVLHVVHHAMVPVIFWLGMLITPTGHYTFAGWLNAGVHFFMYTYYMFAAMGPKYQKYIWWKVHLTKMQLIQFATVLLHTVYSLVTDCKIPKVFGLLMIFQAMLFFALFYNYYQKNFPKNQSAAETIKVYNKTIKSIKNGTSWVDNVLKNKGAARFFEMCIPNQQTLFEDDDEVQVSSPSKNGVPKQKLRVHSD